MANNKVVEIIQKGSPEWGKRFNTHKHPKLGVRSGLKQLSIASRMRKSPSRSACSTALDTASTFTTNANAVKGDIRANEASLKTMVKPTNAHSINVIHTLVQEPSTPENPAQEPPTEIPNNPPDELPPGEPQETPPGQPEELPHDEPQELPPGTP